jgi:hypothetical protein
MRAFMQSRGVAVVVRAMSPAETFQDDSVHFDMAVVKLKSKNTLPNKTELKGTMFSFPSKSFLVITIDMKIPMTA